MQELNPSLINGALNAGTAQVYQQLIFRPTAAALGRPAAPVANLYLAGGTGRGYRRRSLIAAGA